MKYALLALALAVALAGCITEPKPAGTHRVFNISPDCIQHEDSVTFTDTGEVWHNSCRMNATDSAKGGAK